jgi:AcrR family transcriptional regulator
LAVPLKSEPSTPPRSARFQEKREAILNAAATHFNERGVRGAGLGEIASSVGLVTSGITYYFRKKEDLAAACLQRAIVESQRLVIEAARESTVPQRIERLFELQAERLAAVQRGEQAALIGFSDARALPKEQASGVFGAYIDLFRSYRSLLQGAGGPTLGREARNARTHLLLSVVNAMEPWFLRFEPDEYQRPARRIALVLLQGVLGQSHAASLAAMEATDLLAPPPPAADETAEAFLQAATELVNSQGYRGASVDKIAALLNATKGKFYYYNETKIDLVTACFERSFALQRHFLKLAEGSEGSNATRIRMATTALVHFQLTDRGPLLRGSAFSALPDQEHRHKVYRTAQQLTERMASLLVDAVIDGSVAPQDPAIAAEMLYAAINAAAELPDWVPAITSSTVTRLYTRPCLLGLLCTE